MSGTEALIRALAREGAVGDGAPIGRALVRRLAAAALGGVALAAAASASLGLRADVAAFAPSAITLLKAGGGFALLLVAGAVARRLAEPGRRLGAPLGALGLLVAALVVAGLTSGAVARGGEDWACAAALAALALPTLALGLGAFRRGAAVRPGAAGATLGLAAAGAAAIGYALHCPLEGVGAVALWYGLGAGAAAALGAALGRRALAW